MAAAAAAAADDDDVQPLPEHRVDDDGDDDDVQLVFQTNYQNPPWYRILLQDAPVAPEIPCPGAPRGCRGVPARATHIKRDIHLLECAAGAGATPPPEAQGPVAAVPPPLPVDSRGVAQGAVRGLRPEPNFPIEIEVLVHRAGSPPSADESWVSYADAVALGLGREVAAYAELVLQRQRAPGVPGRYRW